MSQNSERLILAFGDSLTAGYRLKPTESFPAQLETMLRADGQKVRVSHVPAAVTRNGDWSIKRWKSARWRSMQKASDRVKATWRPAARAMSIALSIAARGVSGSHK